MKKQKLIPLILGGKKLLIHVFIIYYFLNFFKILDFICINVHLIHV